MLGKRYGKLIPMIRKALEEADGASVAGAVARGETVDARAYRLVARNVELTVWYSDDEEWLGLESVAKGGRIIRYELT